MNDYSQKGKDFGSTVLDGMAKELGGNFDIGVASSAVNKSIKALEKQAAAMEQLKQFGKWIAENEAKAEAENKAKAENDGCNVQ